MVRDTIQLETAVSTISQEYLLEFTFEYGITDDLHPELPGPGDKIVDFPEGKVGVYTKVEGYRGTRLWEGEGVSCRGTLGGGKELKPWEMAGNGFGGYGVTVQVVS
ncbi:hypothetical protein Tco_1159040, partial [Tanacetum coccineum]